jgi:hypothetical protein
VTREIPVNLQNSFKRQPKRKRSFSSKLRLGCCCRRFFSLCDMPTSFDFGRLRGADLFVFDRLQFISEN